MKNKITGSILFCLLWMNMQAQVKWPAVTETTKPWTRWWWMGSAVDANGISRQLGEISKVGFGGVEIVPIYGAIGYEEKYIKYLSPQWMKMLEYTTSKAASLHMGVDMAVGTGWPIGGPQVTLQDAATKLTVQKYTLQPGETLKEKIELSDARQRNDKAVFLTAVVAYDNKGQAVDLTGKVSPDGSLNWKAGDGGPWQIFAAFNAKTRQAVKRAAYGGEGYTLDHFSASAVNHYFNTFDSVFGNSPHGVHAFFNDSYEVYNADWTPGFFQEFQKRRGYDLKPYLKELVATEKTETTGRVKSDYRQTMSDLMLENFTQNFTRWAHLKKALNTNQAHGSPGNLLDLYAAVDIPECETFGSSAFNIKGLRRDSADVRNVDPDPVMLKFASSAAHAKGKPLTSCETFTWLTEHFKTSWSQCKPEVEQVFLSGVNHVFYHGTTYTPADVTFPGWLFYASVNFVPQNSLWPQLTGLNQYITRCQSVLQAGQPDNEVKAYWPVFDAWNNPEGLDMPFKIHDIDVWLHPTPFYKNVVSLQNKGFSIDFVSDKMLADQVATGAAKPVVYLVAECNHMPVKTFASLMALAKAGHTIVMQSLPKDVPGLANLQQERNQLKQMISAISFKEIKNGISEFKTGKGKMILAGDVQQGLEYANLERETLTDLGLKFIRRKTNDGKYYYIVNHTAEKIDTTITLATLARSVSILDPQTGRIGLAKITAANHAVKVRIALASGEALILKTSSFSQSAPAWRYLSATGEAVKLGNAWQLKFTSGGPTLPAERTLTKPRNWTTFEDTASSYFSGTGVYTTEFDLPSKKAAGYLLDLGKVNESARIFINDKDAGVIWSLPFTMEIGQYLEQGKNTIRIEVANLMANRIRYMDQQKMQWRKYHEINFVNINYKDFDAAGWKVQPSGLEGPVTITEMK